MEERRRRKVLEEEEEKRKIGTGNPTERNQIDEQDVGLRSPFLTASPSESARIALGLLRPAVWDKFNYELSLSDYDELYQEE